MTYFFYSKSDKNKEPINIVEATSIGEALTYFAKVKNMSEDDFCKIYVVSVFN